jgi:arylsulfatase A-like enzyme
MILKKILSFVLFILIAGCGTEPIQQPKPPNIVLLSIDTLRADRLGLYGNNRSVSPVLDHLSRQGHTFCSVTAQSPLTAPSHMTLFTSRYPEVHQVRNIGDGEAVTLSSGIPTLAEQLKMNGYGTVAFTEGGNINSALGFGKGFDMYEETGAEKFTGFIKLEPREPWFAFLHTYFVHDPYIVPDPYDKMFDPDYTGGIKGRLESYANTSNFFSLRAEFWDTVDFSDPRDRKHLVNLYDSSIRIIDISLRSLINQLKELGLKDNTILIVTSDHGEEFFEHSRILHERLYVETLHVPLIMIDFRNSDAGQLIEMPIQLIDLAPTILDYLNLPPLPGAQGVSVKASLYGENMERRPLHALAHAPYNSQMTGKGSWKYIFNPITNPRTIDAWWMGLPRPAVPEEELYNIDNDPGEMVNLTDTHPKTLEEMRKMNRDHQANMKVLADQITQETTHVDENVMDMLQALGYVE